MGDVITNIIQDKQDIKDQLGNLPDTMKIPKRFESRLTLKEVVTKYVTKTYDGSENVFILNSPVYGVLGSNKLGDSASTISNYAIIPNNNVFQEYFGQDDYINTNTIRGLKGWWKLNDNALDSIGSNDGSWNGSSDYEEGHIINSQSANFTTSSNIELPTLTGFGTGKTIAFWVKPQINTVRARFIDSNTWCRFYFNPSSDDLTWFSGNGSSWSSGSTANNVITYDQWTHILMEDDGVTLNLRVNNILVDTDPSIGLGDMSYKMYIGDFLEQIQDVRIYNEILPQKEKDVIYKSGQGNVSNSFSSGTINTTNETYMLDAGETLESEIICKLKNSINKIHFFDNDSEDLEIQASNDGGDTWLMIPKAQDYVFSNTTSDDELKYRITNTSDSVITIENPLVIKIN